MYNIAAGRAIASARKAAGFLRERREAGAAGGHGGLMRRAYELMGSQK